MLPKNASAPSTVASTRALLQLRLFVVSTSWTLVHVVHQESDTMTISWVAVCSVYYGNLLACHSQLRYRTLTRWLFQHGWRCRLCGRRLSKGEGWLARSNRGTVSSLNGFPFNIFNGFIAMCWFLIWFLMIRKFDRVARRWGAGPERNSTIGGDRPAQAHI